MPDEIGLFEAMYTQRALRYIKPDPIPDDLVRRVIDAGIHAPNGGNQQRWGFVVIKDPDVKRKIAERYKDTDRPAHTRPPDASSARNDHSANYLADHLADVPVVILCCVRRPGGEGSGSDIGHGASIYPAVQNMLLAARGLGLASVLTTRPRRGFEQEMKEWVGVPDEFDTAALLPLGYPVDGYHYGPTTRRPMEEVTYVDRWGQNWQSQT